MLFGQKLLVESIVFQRENVAEGGHSNKCNPELNRKMSKGVTSVYFSGPKTSFAKFWILFKKASDIFEKIMIRKVTPRQVRERNARLVT